MDLKLEGKRALVAAASTGLGFSIAKGLAAHGCRVAISSRDEARLAEAAAAIDDATGVPVETAVVDVTEPGAQAAWISGTARSWKGIDIVIPNAGGPPPGKFGDVGPDDWDAAYRLTLRSALEAADAAGGYLGRGGTMLFLTSASVRQPAATLALSTVFRAGVSALAKLLADEWAVSGIRVNQLIPGRIETDRLVQLDEAEAKRRGVSAAQVQADIERSIPLRRYGDPDEFAAAALFLVSDAASYITGATLAVDGGLLRPIV